MHPWGPIPEHPAPVSGSGLKLHARAGLLCNDRAGCKDGPIPTQNPKKARPQVARDRAQENLL